MKISKIVVALFLAVTLFLCCSIQAQKFPKMDVSPMDVSAFPIDYKISDKLIKIAYSRPQLKGRTVSKLAPKGKVWRTGANEAAELTLYSDMKLGGKTVKAGSYTFYVIPGDKKWTAIINTDLNVWGSYFYDETKDVARLTVPVSTDKKSLEAFSVVFTESDDGVNMHLGWGTIRVMVPFTK